MAGWLDQALVKAFGSLGWATTVTNDESRCAGTDRTSAVRYRDGRELCKEFACGSYQPRSAILFEINNRHKVCLVEQFLKHCRCSPALGKMLCQR